MVKKTKTDVDRLLLVLTMKTKMSDTFFWNWTFFLISKPKVVYLHPFLSYLSFSKFCKENFMYIRHKYVETQNQSNLLRYLWCQKLSLKKSFSTILGLKIKLLVVSYERTTLFL